MSQIGKEILIPRHRYLDAIANQIEAKICIWPAHPARQAEITTRSEYFEFSNELIKGRRSDVMMINPVERENND
jgi:hypothetical protein